MFVSGPRRHCTGTGGHVPRFLCFRSSYIVRRQSRRSMSDDGTVVRTSDRPPGRMPSRRFHQKSRSGCARCKARRVKASLTSPIACQKASPPPLREPWQPFLAVGGTSTIAASEFDMIRCFLLFLHSAGSPGTVVDKMLLCARHYFFPLERPAEPTSCSVAYRKAGLRCFSDRTD